MGDQKLLVIVGGVFVLTFLPIIIVIALILGSIAGLDDEPDCSTGGAYPGGNASFGFPTGPDDRDVAAGFEGGSDPENPRHGGIDYDVGAGTDVRAAADGQVLSIDNDTIKIQHPNNFQTWYQFVDADVEADEEVRRGRKIGESSSGEENDPGVRGEHLHFEIRIEASSLNDEGQAVDPNGLLQDLPANDNPDNGNQNGEAPSQQELNPYPITMAQLEMELDQTQLGYVDTIIGVGKAENIPARGWVIALAVVAVESGFRPNACCDHDSLGLFQQRASWGSAEDRTDPASSARMFYRGDGTNGLGPTIREFSNWQTEQLWLIAGEAQEPDTCWGPNCEDLRLRYGKWERWAINLVLAHHGAAPIPGGGQGCQGGGGIAIGDYAFPLEHDSILDTYWLTKPHHDYPAADIPVPTGTEAYAVTGGQVSYVGGACGTGLVITTPDGVEYVYCHGESRTVSDGATVRAAELVMITNDTGRSSGPHLHFGIRTSDGTQRCPQDMLLALYNGEQPPAPDSLASSGCSN